LDGILGSETFYPYSLRDHFWLFIFLLLLQKSFLIAANFSEASSTITNDFPKATSTPLKIFGSRWRLSEKSATVNTSGFRKSLNMGSSSFKKLFLTALVAFKFFRQEAFRKIDIIRKGFYSESVLKSVNARNLEIKNVKDHKRSEKSAILIV
jgi:hypothetical protein